MRLLVSHEREIKSWMVALMARIRARDCESAYEPRCVSRSVQSEWRQYNTVAATPTLHQQVAIPFVGHSQCEGDTEFLAANSNPAMDDAFDPTVGRKRPDATLVPGDRLGASSLDFSGLGDLDVWKLDVYQTGARVPLLGERRRREREYKKECSA
jgi:hypothetical protein